jgi:hypothetical protein
VSNNDTMVKCLSKTIVSFPGATNQMCCFVHTLSISAKAISKQFDIPKGQHDSALDVAAQAFADLAEELEMEEALVMEIQEMVDEEEEDQPLDSWVNFCEGLNEEEHNDLDASIQPVWLMLIKVCCLIAYVCLFDP